MAAAAAAARKDCHKAEDRAGLGAGNMARLIFGSTDSKIYIGDSSQCIAGKPLSRSRGDSERRLLASPS